MTRLEVANHILQSGNPNDHIAVTYWSTDDIKERAEGLEVKLTAQDCITIIDKLQSNLDNDVIDWDTLDFVIQDYAGQAEKFEIGKNRG